MISAEIPDMYLKWPVRVWRLLVVTGCERALTGWDSVGGRRSLLGRESYYRVASGAHSGSPAPEQG